MKAPPASSLLVRTFSAIGIFLALGCRGPAPGTEELAEISVAITRAPSGLRCLRITASGPRTVVRNFSLATGATTVFNLGDLPVGNVVVEAVAFSTTCGSSSANATPDWQSDPVAVVLHAGRNPDIKVAMHQSASGKVAVDFPGEPLTCAAPGAICTANEQCCSNRCDLATLAPARGACRGLEVLEGPLADLPAQIKERDLRLNPPRVIQAQAGLAPGGGSLLFLRFAPDQRLGRTVTLQPDGRELVLHDDGAGGDARAGDGTFTAPLPFTFESVRTAMRARFEMIDKNGPQPLFEGRELKGFKKVELHESAKLIDIVMFPTSFGIDSARSLTVTDLGVIENPDRTFNPCTGAGTPMGKWTFGYLVTQIANQALSGVTPEQLVETWIAHWGTDQTIGASTVAASRAAMVSYTDSWARLPDGRIDLAKIPLRLMAIVNRIDLAGNSAYGAVQGAEGRFVFAMVDPTTCSSKPGTVILEYGIPLSGCSGLRDWARQWIDLGDFSVGSADYNAALEVLTDRFTAAGADPFRINGSALNQLRTNEDLQGLWQLREFRLAPDAFLRETTTKQTPVESFNALGGGARRAHLTTWVGANLADVEAGLHVVPSVFPFPPGGDFLAAAPEIDEPQYWEINGVSAQARFQFSTNTCNGCHSDDETGTVFTMIRPTAFGAVPILSPFLTGGSRTDPVNPPLTHSFNDLLRRKGVLQSFADSACLPFLPMPVVLARELMPIPPLAHVPVLMTH